jgi:hypothetical protein
MRAEAHMNSRWSCHLSNRDAATLASINTEASARSGSDKGTAVIAVPGAC